MKLYIKYIHKLFTCVRPPELSCTRLLEREAAEQNDEHIDPKTLQTPLATNS